MDLEELSYLGLIPIEWKTILSRLTGKSNQQNPALEKEIPEKSQRLSKNRSRSTHLVFRPIQPVFRPGYFFWFIVFHQRRGNELIFRPVGEVRTIIFEKPERDHLDATMMKMEYLAILSLSLLAKIKKLHVYSEDLLENSAVCSGGLWRISEKNSFYNKLKTQDTSISYLQYESMRSWEELNEFFMLHNHNFRGCFHVSLLKKIAAEEGNYHQMILLTYLNCSI